MTHSEGKSVFCNFTSKPRGERVGGADRDATQAVCENFRPGGSYPCLHSPRALMPDFFLYGYRMSVYTASSSTCWTYALGDNIAVSCRAGFPLFVKGTCYCDLQRQKKKMTYYAEPTKTRCVLNCQVWSSEGHMGMIISGEGDGILLPYFANQNNTLFFLIHF